MTNCWIFEIMKLVCRTFLHQQIVCFPFFLHSYWIGLDSLHVGGLRTSNRPLNELIGEEEEKENCIAFQKA